MEGLGQISANSFWIKCNGRIPCISACLILSASGAISPSFGQPNYPKWKEWPKWFSYGIIYAMIRCRPKGLFSREFDLQGDGHQGSLEFNWMSEQGALVADGASFEIDKHGVFRRTFEIESPMGLLELRAESIFTRSFQLKCAGELVARFKANHLFSRSSQIHTADSEVHFPTLAFSFWLILITRRRAQNNNS
jgi:hypothetical protein